MRFDALLFDFDGVLIESERASNAQIARWLTDSGRPTSPEQAMKDFMGLSGPDFLAALGRMLGGVVPESFHAARREEAARAMAEGIAPVAGAIAFVRDLPAELPIAVASSSTTAWISAHLRHLGLADRFGDRLVSGGEHVARGKPAPDIYLHAADLLGVDIARAAVIEDSPVGVTGAAASGAFVIGLCAGGHCGAGHGATLLGLGAHAIAADFTEVRAVCGMAVGS